MNMSMIITRVFIAVLSLNLWVVFESVQAVPVVVSARPLRHGKVIDRTDLEMLEVPAVGAGGAIYEFEDVLGRVMKRSVSKHIILKSNLLRKPYVIERGDEVSVLIEGDGFTVETKGRAQQPASVGEKVMVRIKRRQMVRGTASEDGRVRIKI